MRFLLDTNAVSYALRGEGEVRQHIARRKPGDLFLSSVVVMEVEAGLRRRGRPARLDRLWQVFLKEMKVLPLGVDEALAAADVRVVLEGNGQIIGPFDTLIAGTALSNGAVLVTHNVREFSRVPGLRVEDWYV